MKKRIAALLMATLLILMLTACKKGGEEATTGETATMETTTVETTEPYVPGVGPNIFDDEEALAELEGTEATEAEEKNNSESEKEPTKATEPKATEPKATEPKATEPTPTEPKPTEPKPTEAAPVVEQTEYERYLAMSGDEQKAFMESFGSIEAFFEWLNTAKAEHEALKPDIPIEDGKVDLGKVVDGGK